MKLRLEEMQEREKGQALVELLLMLIVLFALVVGMLHVSNLLNFDYWAQQEARYIAFEQTWYMQEVSSNAGNDAVGDLDDDDRFHRPRSVARLNADRRSEDDGGVRELLNLDQLAFDDSDSDAAEAAGTPIFLARADPKEDAIWYRSTREWWGSVKEKTSFVQTAYASVRDGAESMLRGDGIVPNTRIDVAYDDSDPQFYPPDSLEDGMVKIMTTVQFGEAFCEEMAGLFERRGYGAAAKGFREEDCGPSYNRDFGLFIARNIDIASLFRDYSGLFGQGLGHQEAIEVILQREIASQFYSMFDRDVKTAGQLAVPLILRKRIDLRVLSSDTELRRLITDARYLGSSVALTTILFSQLGQTFLVNPQGRDPDIEKLIHDIVVFFIHADVGETALFLNPVASFPVPPTFQGAFTAFQEGVMENVLLGGRAVLGSFLGDPTADESELRDPLINDSNKKGTVRYDAGRSVITAARDRFSDETTLTSRFFLVTQPWHITRRIDGTGDFRLPGDETDGIGEDTDEAMLRRRVAGLWLFPSAPGALFTAPLEIFPVPGFSEIAAVARGLDGPISGVKSFLIQNPINNLLDILSNIPFIGGLVPTIPKWPAVRPLAYPGSTELRGQQNSDDDMLTGTRRNFSDYVEEQNYNPPARPQFDNGTFN
ncbi:MAG: hypothetical protein KDD69_07750 [Bdellovibrionales bacterium]|nr:hypothetical protein [Bdellovibrionales bacterium]